MKKILLIFLGIFVYGCGSAGNQLITDRSKIQRIQEGISTKADVQAAVGAPAKITPLPQGELWEYSHMKMQVNPASYIPIIGLGVLASGYGTFNEAHQLSILFDNQGIVSKVEAGKSNPKVYMAPGYGKATQGETETIRSTHSNRAAPVPSPPITAKPNPPTSKRYEPVN